MDVPEATPLRGGLSEEILMVAPPWQNLGTSRNGFQGTTSNVPSAVLEL